MAFKLRTRSFQVEEATLGGALFRPYWKRFDSTLISDRLWWSLDFACSEKEFDGETWGPEFTFHPFLLPIKNWLELEGLTTRLDGGNCSIVGQGSVGRTDLELGKRTGSRFQLTCEGVCDVYWDDPFGTAVPFTLRTRVEFEGIRVVGTSDDDDDSLREFLEAHFRIDQLSANPCKEHGTPSKSRKKMIEKMFVPI